MSTLYFAYGSNLNADDLARWCKAGGRAPPLGRALGTAFLPDSEACFRYRSSSRRCGVLDFRPALGRALPGVLFEVNGDDGWAALREKEGAPHCYRERAVWVLSDDGRERRATTFEVLPELREEFVQPDPAYLRIVSDGLDAFGIDASHIVTAATNGSAGLRPAELFVYGTLMEGQPLHWALAAAAAPLVGAASAPGVLHDLGNFPGLRPADPPARVHGELYRLPGGPGGADLLYQLDYLEGFYGYESEGSLYRRALARTSLGLAWTYVLVDVPEGARPIASGDWRQR